MSGRFLFLEDDQNGIPRLFLLRITPYVKLLIPETVQNPVVDLRWLRMLPRKAGFRGTDAGLLHNIASGLSLES